MSDLRRNNTSGRTGVQYSPFHAKHGKPWTATVTVGYIPRYLGCYATKQEAIDARELWETDHADIMNNRYPKRPMSDRRIWYEVTLEGIAALNRGAP